MSPPDRVDSALDYGDEAVSHALDAILESRAASDPLRKETEEEKAIKKCKKKARGKTLVIIAGGWNYQSKDDEIYAIKHGGWNPTTKDFTAVAEGSNSIPLSAINPHEFLQHVSNEKKGSVGRVVFIGHGGNLGIQFSGDVDFRLSRSLLNEDNLSDFQTLIENNVRPALHANAKIDLVTCGNGADINFMSAMAHAFNRCIRAFSSAIEYRTPVVETQQITERGLIRIEGSKKYRKGWKHLVFPECVCP